MSKKLYGLISAVVAGLQTIAVGVIDFSVENAGTYEEAIAIAGTAILAICGLFIKPADKTE